MWVAQFLPNKVGSLDKEISLKAADNKELLKIRWGALKTVSLQTKLNSSVFEAQTSVYPGAVSIFENDINSLKLDEILKKAEVKK